MNATADGIAKRISEAPAWAPVSLTMPDEALRQEGDKSARWIAGQGDAPDQDSQ